MLWSKKKIFQVANQKDASDAAILLLHSVKKIIFLRFTFSQILNGQKQENGQEENVEFILSCLATVGTIMMEDPFCETLSFFDWSKHHDQNIRGVAEFILHLSDCQIESVEYNR